MNKNHSDIGVTVLPSPEKHIPPRPLIAPPPAKRPRKDASSSLHRGSIEIDLAAVDLPKPVVLPPTPIPAEEVIETNQILESLASVCQGNDACCAISLHHQKVALLKFSDSNDSFILNRFNQFLSFKFEASDEAPAPKEITIKESLLKNKVNFMLLHTVKSYKKKLQVQFPTFFYMDKGVLEQKKISVPNEDEKKYKRIVIQLHKNRDLILETTEQSHLSNILSSEFFRFFQENYLPGTIDKAYILSNDGTGLYYADRETISTQRVGHVSKAQITAIHLLYQKINQTVARTHPVATVLSSAHQGELEQILGQKEQMLVITANALKAKYTDADTGLKNESMMAKILTYFTGLYYYFNMSDASVTALLLKQGRIGNAIISTQGDITSRFQRDWDHFKLAYREEVITQMLSSRGLNNLNLEKFELFNPDVRISFLMFLSAALHITNAFKTVETAILAGAFSFAHFMILRIGEEKEHAEMRQLTYLLQLGFFTNKDYYKEVFYFATSKACCLNCHLFIEAVKKITNEVSYLGGVIVYSQKSHGIYFTDIQCKGTSPQWMMPSGFLPEEEDQSGILKNYDKMSQMDLENQVKTATFTEAVIALYAQASKVHRQAYLQKKRAVSAPLFKFNPEVSIGKNLTDSVNDLDGHLKSSKGRNEMPMANASPPKIVTSLRNLFFTSNQIREEDVAETFSSATTEELEEIYSSITLDTTITGKPPSFLNNISQPTKAQQFREEIGSLAPLGLTEVTITPRTS